jgi:hypothetical protein
LIFAHFEGASNDRCILYYRLGELRARELDGLVLGPGAVTIVEVKTAVRLSRLRERQQRDVEQVRRSCELSRQASPTSGLLIQVAGDYVCRGSEALLVGGLDETVRNAGTPKQVRVLTISRRDFEHLAADQYMTFKAYRQRSLDWLRQRYPVLGPPTVGKVA